MYTVSLYKSKLAKRPDNLYTFDHVHDETIEQMLIKQSTKDGESHYERLNVPLYSIAANDEIVSPALWDSFVIRDGMRLHIVVEPKVNFIPAIIALVAAAYAYTQIPDIPDDKGSIPEGKSIYKASGQTNAAKPNGIVPQYFGRMPIYPDKITAGYRQYEGDDEWYYVLLCVGLGKYEIEQVKLAYTDATNYAGDMLFNFYEPGESVVDNPAHRNIYTAPEVGRTSSGAIELKYDSKDLSSDKWSYDFEGKTITAKNDGIPAGFPFSVGEEFKIPGDSNVYRVEEISGDADETATVSRGFYLNFRGGFI